MLLTHPTRRFFTLPVDFPPRDEEQDRRVCAEIHGKGPHPRNMPPHPIHGWGDSTGRVQQ